MLRSAGAPLTLRKDAGQDHRLYDNAGDDLVDYYCLAAFSALELLFGTNTR